MFLFWRGTDWLFTGCNSRLNTKSFCTAVLQSELLSVCLFAVCVFRLGLGGWNVWAREELQHQWRHRPWFSFHHRARDRPQVSFEIFAQRWRHKVSDANAKKTFAAAALQHWSSKRCISGALFTATTSSSYAQMLINECKTWSDAGETGFDSGIMAAEI